MPYLSPATLGKARRTTLIWHGVGGRRRTVRSILKLMTEQSYVLVMVAGPDLVGASSRFFAALSALEVVLIDVEQVTTQGQLVLTCLVDTGNPQVVLKALTSTLAPLGLSVSVSTDDPDSLHADVSRMHVTLLAPVLTPAHLAAVATTIAGAGGNIDRIGQLGREPLTVYELVVSGGELGSLRTSLTALGAELGIDVAVQDDDIHRRAKRLIVLDVDSTLVQGEVIDSLAARAGRAAEVAAITERAMAGELDFAESLEARVSWLSGLPVSVLDEIAAGLKLTPGARTLVRTLHQLGYSVGVVSGGFTFATNHLQKLLGLDFAEANTLEVSGGVLTGRVLPPIMDRAGKAHALQRFAGELGVDMTQTVAVGDGANDLDMLAAAGLGIAFNAKPIVRREAAVSLSSPYLDAVLFLLGLSAAEIAALS